MKAKYNHSMKNQFLFLILILILGCSNSDQSSKDISDQIREDTSDQSTKDISDQNLEEHYFNLENNIPKDYFAQEIITSTDVPLTYKDQYNEIQDNLNSIIGSYQKYIMFITTTNEFSMPVFDRLEEVGWRHPLEINIADNGKPYLNRAGCLTGAGAHPSDGSLPDPYSLCIMDYEFIQYPHESKERGSPLSERQAVIYHGWAHEYFHHYQRSHSFERSMGMEGECCGGHNHINSPAWWVEGAAGIFPNLWLRHYWKEFSEFENLNYEDVDVEMMNLDNYYIDAKKEMQGLGHEFIHPNKKACTEFTDKEDYRETGYCNWSIFNAYIAYISSYQALWVGIPRDYHELGFDESFRKHVGITKEEAYENYKIFMNSEDPNSPAPVGFFPEGPITDYADFLIINSPQEIYDIRLEELKNNQFSTNN